MVGELEQRGDAILRRLSRDARATEVGVFLGALSEYLLRRNPSLHLTMVDNWLPAECQPRSYRDTGDEHANASAEKVAIQRTEAFRRAAIFGDRAKIIEKTSAAAAREALDASLDLVFLDADHSYDGVRDDIASWLPKVRLGGWIGGHDYDNPTPLYDFSGVKRAVDEAFGDRVETDLNFTWWVRV